MAALALDQAQTESLDLSPDKLSMPVCQSPTPFTVDCIVSRAAEQAGFEVYRRAVVDIADPKLLPESYWKKSPDYQKIRKALDAGVKLPGCTLTTRVEYVLTESKTEEFQ